MKYPKEKILITVLLLVLLFVLTSVIISSDTSVHLSARAVSLYEPVTESFLYTKNADTPLPMASTTKIMTALVAIENYPLDKEVTVADEATGIEGSSLYLKPGEVLTMRELLYGLMLRSANDAAAAIAYAVSGGITEFADMMNERAISMGLENTHFCNPHGLDAPEHFTTARELAKIAAEALKNPDFKQIASTYKKTITSSENEARLVVNHNKLLHLYDGAIGVKTGFTKKCGRCLVGAAERDGLTFITVTIDAPDDWNDHIKLFDLGFSSMELKRFGKGDFSYEIPVINRESQQRISVSNKEEFSLVTKKGDSGIIPHVRLSRYASAPVSEGDIMGKVIFTKDGEYVGELDLTADSGIQKETKRGFFSFFKK